MSDDNVPRRMGHALTKIDAGLQQAICECGKTLELNREDIARLARAGTSLHDALLDAHKVHLASMEEQGR